MKKYIFSILLFLGCFFVSLAIDNSLVSAVSETIAVDPYDSKKIKITLDELSGREANIKIHEIEYCSSAQEESCNEVLVGGENKIFKIKNTTEFEVDMNRTTTAVLDYTLKSDSDGLKHFFVEPFKADESPLLGYYHVFEYELSTLNQRIIINADANGQPRHMYDNVQYISVRVLPITIKFLQEELDSTYSGLVYICEVGNVCREYEVNDDLVNYSLDSYGDGLKQLNIYLVKKDQVIDSTKLETELKDETKIKLISKNIYLDTIGPKISVEGLGDSWVWAYVEAGKKYEVAKAICVDAVFSSDECVVSNDADIVKIDYTSDKYQFVTYEATDRLGNVTSVPVRIKVETSNEDDSNLGLILGVSGGILVLTGIILTYILFKNNEKKKKLSYI